MVQKKQKEWFEQWNLVQDNELFLFEDWISPTTLEDFRDKDVLECGSGGGQHTYFVAPYAKSICAVDLNAVEIAKKRNNKFNNIDFIEDDIANMKLEKKFDIVFSIGVIHHTDDPDKTVRNLIDHTKPSGKLIMWVYSKEGNFLVEHLVEPLRKIFLHKISRKKLLLLSQSVTALMYLPIYSLYMLPINFLPFYEYFQNFRKLSFYRNTLNVFDKLNAPQVQFINKSRAKSWLNDNEFTNIHLSPYKGVSWRISGIKL
ncbi:MAG: class I SAM-dependent methyltransferase [bacterium]